MHMHVHPPPTNNNTNNNNSPQQKPPLKKPPCRCYSLQLPSSVLLTNVKGTGKGNDERSATWWLFFSVRFPNEVLGPRSGTPLAPAPTPWAMQASFPCTHAPSIDQPMERQVDGALVSDGAVSSARTTFASEWARCPSLS